VYKRVQVSHMPEGPTGKGKEVGIPSTDSVYEEEPPVPSGLDSAPEDGLPCPDCGTPMHRIDEYMRNFCHACRKYAPKGYGSSHADDAVPGAMERPASAFKGARRIGTSGKVPELPPVPHSASDSCPSCGNMLAFMEEFNRYYCYSCGKYADKGVGKDPSPQAQTAVHAALQAMGEDTKLPAVSAGIPRPSADTEAPCPDCGAKMDYVKEYSRYHCPDCKDYR